MKDEIKEMIPENVKLILDDINSNILWNYITNLQEQLHQASLDIQELTEKDIGCPSWCDKLTNLQEKNKKLQNRNIELVLERDRLKELCNKYEEEHSTTFEEWKKDINIIDELEKLLEDYIKLFNQPDMLEEQTLEDLKEVLYKLRELKEGKDND